MFSLPGPLSVLLIAVALFSFFMVHFIPAFIAGSRQVRHFWWIVAINFFLGWTVIGWLVALVWALRDEPVVRRRHRRGYPGRL